MRVDDYLRKADFEWEWWHRRLHADGAEVYASEVIRTGPRKFATWIETEQETAALFVAASKSERGAKLHSLPEKARLHWTLAAVYRFRCGRAWLQAASSLAVDTAIDIHPLTMLDRAAGAARRLHSDWPGLWPFPDYPDPFDGMR